LLGGFGANGLNFTNIAEILFRDNQKM